MPLIRVKKRGRKFLVTVIEKGTLTTHEVDDIYVDTGYGVAFSKYGGGQLTTDLPCRVVDVELLPGIREKVLACTRKSVEELRKIIKYT